MSRDEVGILGILTFLLPVTPLVYRAVTRVIHTFRSLPCFWSVSQLLFCTFILVSTICLQVSFGLPLLRFPSGAQNCFLNTVQFPSKYIAKSIPTSSEHSWGHVLPDNCREGPDIRWYWTNIVLRSSSETLYGMIIICLYTLCHSPVLWPVQNFNFVLKEYWLELQTVCSLFLPWIVYVWYRSLLHHLLLLCYQIK